MDKNEIITVIVRRADGGGTRYSSLDEALADELGLTPTQVSEWVQIIREAETMIATQPARQL